MILRADGARERHVFLAAFANENWAVAACGTLVGPALMNSL
jgi:hypothetical protein